MKVDREFLTGGRQALTGPALTQALMEYPASLSTFQPIAGLEGFDAAGGAIRDLSILTVHRRQILEYGANGDRFARDDARK